MHYTNHANRINEHTQHGLKGKDETSILKGDQKPSMWRARIETEKL